MSPHHAKPISSAPFLSIDDLSYGRGEFCKGDLILYAVLRVLDLYDIVITFARTDYNDNRNLVSQGIGQLPFDSDFLAQVELGGNARLTDQADRLVAVCLNTRIEVQHDGLGHGLLLRDEVESFEGSEQSVDTHRSPRRRNVVTSKSSDQVIVSSA